MPVYSVYVKQNEANILNTKGLSPAKVFSLGLQMFDQGGVEEVKNTLSNLRAHVKELESTLEMKEIWKVEILNKFTNLETQRSRLIDELMKRGLTLEECKKIYSGEV